MPGFIDLHTHTTASDGALTPSQLVRYAEECGLCAIAITDHDAVGGLDEAKEAAQGLDIELINGIEFSATYDKELHILGYYIDPYAAILQGAMQELSEKRAKRNMHMIQKLIENGCDITREDVLSAKESDDIAEFGRLHIALALVNKGYAKNLKEAFSKYLSMGACAYVERERFSPKRCIEIIKKSGGYAFLAHPIYLDKESAQLEEFIEELIGYGLDGIECFHSAHTDEFSALCVDIAKRHSLMISAGSDYHGENKRSASLGRVNNGRYIERDILDDIKNNIAKLK